MLRKSTGSHHRPPSFPAVDPAGNQWTIHNVVEQLPPEALLRCATARALRRTTN